MSERNYTLQNKESGLYFRGIQRKPKILKNGKKSWPRKNITLELRLDEDVAYYELSDLESDMSFALERVGVNCFNGFVLKAYEMKPVRNDQNLKKMLGEITQQMLFDKLAEE